jgi:hypothetical protein
MIAPQSKEMGSGFSQQKREGLVEVLSERDSGSC